MSEIRSCSSKLQYERPHALAVTELQQTAIAKNYVQNMHSFFKNRFGITSLGFSSDLEILFSFLFPHLLG